MKSLLLLRHAKSDWSEFGLDDFVRPLAPRGRAAAPLIGGYLRKKQLSPDLVVCSAARRTRQTWDLVAAELPGTPRTRLLKSLYLAPPSRILSVIHRTPPTVDRLLVIGHNPGLETLARRLAGDGKRKAVARLTGKYPTGALAEIRFAVDDWREIAEGAGVLRKFIRPKDLK